MITVGIGEIQKNISILSKVTDVLEIVDKRKNQKIAVVYPIKKHSTIESLAGKYKGKVAPIDDLDAAKESAMLEAMRVKYVSH